MEITDALIRKIAEFKFGSDKKKIEEYIKKFNLSDPACAEDLKAYQASVEQAEEIGKKRMRAHEENIYIRKFVYDYLTGRLMVYGSEKREGEKVRSDDPLTQKLSEWVSAGFADRPMTVSNDLTYAEAVNRFSRTYGVHIHPEHVAASLREIAKLRENRQVTYRQYFKCMFASVYCRADDKSRGHIDTMCRDFEFVMKAFRRHVCQKENLPEMEGQGFVYGGMKKEDLIDYLTSFREADLDLSAKAVEHSDGVNGSAFEKHFVDSVREILQNGDDEKQTELCCAAQLRAMKKIRESRPGTSFLTSPINYVRERRAFTEIREMIKSAGLDWEKIEELSERDRLFDEKMERERTQISAFGEHMNDADVSEKVTIDNRLVEDFAMEQRVEPTVETPVLKADDPPVLHQPENPVLSPKKPY